MHRLKFFILSFLLSLNLFAASNENEQGYTINFENVQLKELLQFVSKIGGFNVIYNESEVPFQVTFVSDKPTTLTDIKSALIQILRIHNLSMIEEGNNLIIHKNVQVKQIPTVVSKENPLKGEMPSIMTKVFKIHKGNPSSIASIITPLLSTTAMVEVSLDTRQLIVTDVASSINTVKELLKSLDVPQTPYDVDTYEAENLSAKQLELLIKKIMMPLTEGTLLEVVAQPETNSLYIVSTPFLIDKAISILEELDRDVTLSAGTSRRLSGENILIYPLQHSSKETILKTLRQIIDESKKQGLDSTTLKKIVDNSSFVKSTHSLIFIGYPENLALIEALIQNIDNPKNHLVSKKSTFLLFEPKGLSVDDVLGVVDEVVDNLSENGYPNQVLIQTLKNAMPIRDINSILFMADPETEKELEDLLSSIVGSYNVGDTSEFYLYNIKKASEEQMSDALRNLIDYLKKSDYPNTNLINTISSMRWIKASNSLFFVGSNKSLQELANILPTFDVEPSASHEKLTQSAPPSEFLVYSPKNINAQELLYMVEETEGELAQTDLSDPTFMNCLSSGRYLESSDQIIFTGTPEALKRLVILLEKLDHAMHNKNADVSLYIYYPNNLSFEQLKNMLVGVIEDAQSHSKSGYSTLSKTIDTMRPIPNSSGIQFMGTPDTLDKLKKILAQIDGSGGVTTGVGGNILVYKIKSVSPTDLISQLKSLVRQQKGGSKRNKAFIEAIDSVRYVKSSHSLVFVGNQQVLEQIKKVLGDLDSTVARKVSDEKVVTERKVEGYQIYVPQYVPGQELVSMVTNFEAHLTNVGMLNEGLSEVIDHLSYVQKTNTIIVSGEKDSVLEVIALLKQFDNLQTLEATGGLETPMENINDQGFLLYKIQNLAGNEITGALQKISQSLKYQEQGTKKNDDLISAISSIQWIETTNSLIATGSPSVLSKLESLLKNVDRPIAQVFIEVLVLDTTLSDSTTFGLGWQNKGTIYEKFGYSFGNLMPGSDSTSAPLAKNLDGIDNATVPAGKSIPPLAGGYMGIIGDIIFHNGNSYSSIGSLLNALKTEGDTTVVLSQKIVAQDNQNAKIFSGDNVPFTGSLVTTSGLSQTTNANLEYRNIGVTLSITPNISSDGMITLDIDEELSEEANTGEDDSSSDITTASINGIRTSKTNMTTKIRVPDRHFLVLSGTMKNQTVRSVAGVPCLGGLPLIGAAFSKTQKDIQTRNVIIFVKPHIIENTQQYQDITYNQEQIYSGPNQCNTEDFVQGLGLVKTPEDEYLDDQDEDFLFFDE